MRLLLEKKGKTEEKIIKYINKSYIIGQMSFESYVIG